MSFFNGWSFLCLRLKLLILLLNLMVMKWFVLFGILLSKNWFCFIWILICIIMILGLRNVIVLKIRLLLMWFMWFVNMVLVWNVWLLFLMRFVLKSLILKRCGVVWMVLFVIFLVVLCFVSWLFVKMFFVLFLVGLS